jgi:hypothetical protein
MRGARAIVAVGLGGFIAASLFAVSAFLIRGNFLEILTTFWGVAYYIATALFLFIAAWAVWLFGRGAAVLTITTDDLTFQYPGGREDRLVFHDPRFRLTLWDWSPGASILPADALYEASIFNRPRTQLSLEGFEAILNAARERNLSVTERPARASLYGSPGKIFILRAARRWTELPRGAA